MLFCFILLLSSPKSFSGENWQFKYKPFDAAYELYSGELSDPQPAKNEDSSISVKIEKEAAKRIFDQMGRDTPNVCPSEHGERMRRKNDLICYKNKPEKYTCYMGFDLKSGKSKIGAIC
nr:hypothetical protein [Paracidovorax valerianellae]